VVEAAVGEDVAEVAVVEGAVAETTGRGIVPLGLGMGWRAEVAVAIDRDASLKFVEITAEHFVGGRPPRAIYQLRERGLAVIPHGISVSLGSAEGMNINGLKQLDYLAREFGSPFVSEHLAFVREGGVEAGHLLPVPRTRGALNVVVENIKRAQDVLSVPLALENISALFAWPQADFTDGEFLSLILERTGCLLLLDTSNVFANAHNLRQSAAVFFDSIPLNRIAYVHVGGGIESDDGLYHDSHAHPITNGALKMVEELCARIEPPGIMLERDDHFPTEAELRDELSRITSAMERGRSRRAG
jgi:hypothetical protein